MIQVIGVHRSPLTEGEGPQQWSISFLADVPATWPTGITADELPADVRDGLRAWLDAEWDRRHTK